MGGHSLSAHLPLRYNQSHFLPLISTSQLKSWTAKPNRICSPGPQISYDRQHIYKDTHTLETPVIPRLCRLFNPTNVLWRIAKNCIVPFCTFLSGLLHRIRKPQIGTSKILHMASTPIVSFWYAFFAAKLSFRLDDDGISWIIFSGFMEAIQIRQIGRNETIWAFLLSLETGINYIDGCFAIDTEIELNVSWWNISVR